MATVEITETLATRVLNVVDQGLCEGTGKPIPGQMCVEAVVCYASGEPHGDEPTCVSPALRRFLIGLNDAQWSSNEARAKGLRRIAIAQLGTAGELDERLFVMKLARVTISKLLPNVLRSAAALQQEPHKSQLLEAAARCETEGTAAAARWAAVAADAAAARWAAADTAAAHWAAAAADAAADDDADAVADAAADAARWAAVAADAACWTALAADELLSEFAEEVVQILVEMKRPESDFLFLTQ